MQSLPHSWTGEPFLVLELTSFTEGEEEQSNLGWVMLPEANRSLDHFATQVFSEKNLSLLFILPSWSSEKLLPPLAISRDIFFKDNPRDTEKKRLNISWKLFVGHYYMFWGSYHLPQKRVFVKKITDLFKVTQLVSERAWIETYVCLIPRLTRFILHHVRPSIHQASDSLDLQNQYGLRVCWKQWFHYYDPLSPRVAQRRLRSCQKEESEGGSRAGERKGGVSETEARYVALWALSSILTRAVRFLSHTSDSQLRLF